MKRCLDIARQYAATTGIIVIFGETGTGKEVMAQSIHNQSPVADGPFVAINCGALPSNLLESELFGYVEGAFTGASKGGKTGLFELAHNGTIFLDEIHEMDSSLQKKLLRVIQEREIMRIGDDRILPVSVRVIAASNVPLRDEVKQGRMRKDLFYRLNVLDIGIPPLRERRDDILPLFEHYFRHFASVNGMQKDSPLSPGFSHALVAYDWPGNVRELEHVAEKFVILRKLFDIKHVEKIVTESFTPTPGAQDHPAEDPLTGDLRAIEQRLVARVLDEEGGNISRAASRLGIDRGTLRKKLESR
jgi:transcriptional regulator with PAS, ATPase and Fis domain